MVNTTLSTDHGRRGWYGRDRRRDNTLDLRGTQRRRPSRDGIFNCLPHQRLDVRGGHRFAAGRFYRRLDGRRDVRGTDTRGCCSGNSRRH